MKTNSKVNDDLLFEAADEYGAIREEMAKLEARAAELSTLLEASGYDEITGYEFTVDISRFSRANTSWKAIALAAGASLALIKKYTTTVPAHSIRPRRPKVA